MSRKVSDKKREERRLCIKMQLAELPELHERREGGGMAEIPTPCWICLLFPIVALYPPSLCGSREYALILAGKMG